MREVQTLNCQRSQREFQLEGPQFFFIQYKNLQNEVLKTTGLQLLNYITRTITREARTHDYPKGH